MTATPQRRQPVSYTELQEVLATGVFPLATDPVKPGAKPYCYNCVHWKPLEDGHGECGNITARKHALFGDGTIGGVKRMTTGPLVHCPEHEMNRTS